MNTWPGLRITGNHLTAFPELIWVSFCCDQKIYVQHFSQSLEGLCHFPGVLGIGCGQWLSFRWPAVIILILKIISCTLPHTLNCEVVQLLANVMSCLSSSLHENENYVKQSCFCSSVLLHSSWCVCRQDESSHSYNWTRISFKIPSKIDCSFFLPVFLLIGFSLLIFYPVFVPLPGYKHSSQQQQLADACDLYIKE